MKYNLLLFLIICISGFTISCGVNERPPEVETIKNPVTQNQTSKIDSNVSNDAQEKENNYAVAEILSNSKNKYLGSRLFGDSLAVECDGNIYILHSNIMLLNRYTGCIQSLCSDPLCDHNNKSCINTYTINSMISHDGKIFCKGICETSSAFDVSGGGDYKTFVASYDPDTGKFEFLDTWNRELGSVSYAISIHNDYLYYLKRISDTNNTIYRVPIGGGKVEKVNIEEDFIIQFCIDDDVLYYRTNSFTLKRMNLDGSNLETLDENVCIINTQDGNYVTISSINNNGYNITVNGKLLDDAVDSPVDTTILNNSLWYTKTNKVDFGTYTDANGKSHSITSDNGTELFQYDLTTLAKTVYDCSFGYGVSKFYGLIDNYMLLGVLNEERYIELYLVNSDSTDEHYIIYEK